MGEKQSKIRYYDGSEYSGEVNEKGEEHGKGRIHYANSDVLSGIFSNGDCVKGEIKYHNGNVYEGQIENGLYHGQGLLKTNESTIEGLFR